MISAPAFDFTRQRRQRPASDKDRKLLIAEWQRQSQFIISTSKTIPVSSPATTMSKRILVIEDDEVARELMRMALVRRGYKVAVAENGVEGYDSAVFLRPDLIVTDLQMPAADGIHVVRRVRNTPTLETTPILVTTAFGDGTATFSLQQGASAFEPKPINPQSFLTTVERLLAERDTMKAA